MTLVLDASATGALILADEAHPIADLLRERMLRERVMVPWLWWFDIRNILLNGERRRRFGPVQTAAALAMLSDAPIERDAAPSEPGILTFARRHRLTFYDAAYLELAHRQGATLAALDRALIAAARAEAIPLLGA